MIQNIQLNVVKIAMWTDKITYPKRRHGNCFAFSFVGTLKFDNDDGNRIMMQ